MIENLLPGIGEVAVITAFSAFLSKIWANRILQKDRVRYETQMQSFLQTLRLDTEKNAFVHRLQFEKEFDVYLNLWTELLQAGRAATEFRECKQDTGKSHGQQLDEFREATNRFRRRVYDYRPFYDEAIYKLTHDLLDDMNAVFRLARDERRLQRDSEEVNRVIDKINNSVPIVCEAIRHRVCSPQRATNEPA